MATPDVVNEEAIIEAMKDNVIVDTYMGHDSSIDDCDSITIVLPNKRIIISTSEWLRVEEEAI